MKKRVLFLCTGNSCRSQMAEGWANQLLTRTFDAYSAGTEPHSLNPLAVKVMQEAGVDISQHYRRVRDEIKEFVLTLDSLDAKACPARH